MKKRLLIMLTPCALLFASCAPTTLYNWGNYQKYTYNYVKNNTEKDALALTNAYEYMLNNPTGTRKVVPPGICADYGYMLFKDGKKAEALKYMQMEIGLYPESTIFVGRIIKQIEQ